MARPRRRQFRDQHRCRICGGTEFARAVDNSGNEYLGCIRCYIDTGERVEPTLQRQAVNDPPERNHRLILGEAATAAMLHKKRSS